MNSPDHFRNCPCGGYRKTTSNRQVEDRTVRIHTCAGCKSRVTTYEIAVDNARSLGAILRVSNQ